MHTSTGRFLFSRRSPSKRRAFLGVFNITKSFGRHDTCRRPRISLQIKRYKPITPPIIRRKHRELPIFCPRSVCRDLRLQNTRKNARRHHPHMARSKTQARHVYSDKLLPVVATPSPQGGEQVPSRRTPQDERTSAARSAQRGFFHVRGRAGREGRPRAGQLRLLTRRCKPSCAYPRQHRTGCQSGSREASSSQGRSRCSQPGRSRSRRRRKPCCQSRQPER